MNAFVRACRHALALGVSGLLLTPAWGAPLPMPYPADLPPAALVARILDTHPDVLAAGENLGAEEARRERRRAGPHEWNVRLTQQQRSVRGIPDQRYAETALGLERSLRLPGKARLDAALGDESVRGARMAQEDMRHETARRLLADWFEWRRAHITRNEWLQQRDLLARQAAAVGRREQLGDAPRLERLQAQAALAQAEAQLSQAQEALTTLEARLPLEYPGLTLSLQTEPAPGMLPPLAGDGETWTAEVLNHNHALSLARSESARARLEAARSDAERLPDPTLGIQLARERAGEERILGVSLSIPLPGAGRQADVATTGALARAAAQKEAALLRRLQGEARGVYQHYLGSRAAWQRQAQAAEALEASARITEKAWSLGEGSLSDTLQARRLAHEARLAERLAALEARESQLRLLVDAHRLWGDDDEPAAP